MPDISLLSDIASFRDRFRRSYPDPTGSPTLYRDRVRQYVKFFEEELVTELTQALDNADESVALAEVADALADGLVFISHLIHYLDLQDLFPHVWAEVQKSNATKGDLGKLFAADGKMIKGPDYRRADHSWLFQSSYTVYAPPNSFAALAIDDLVRTNKLTVVNASAWLVVVSGLPGSLFNLLQRELYPVEQGWYVRNCCPNSTLALCSNGIGNYFVECSGCGATSAQQDCESRRAAIERWNSNA